MPDSSKGRTGLAGEDQGRVIDSSNSCSNMESRYGVEEA